jgi:hypothetical protein
MTVRLRRIAAAGLVSLAVAAPVAGAACVPTPAPKPTPGRGTPRINQFCTTAKEATYNAAGFTCLSGRLAKK